MKNTISHHRLTQNIFQNIQKNYKNFLLTLLTIGSLNIAQAQQKQLNPTANLSFFHTSPLKYQDLYLDSLLTSFSSNDSSLDSLKQTLEKYLPSDIHKGMVLCSSEKRAEVIEKIFPTEGHRLQKEAYLYYRDTILNMIQEDIPEESVSLIQVSFNPTIKDMTYQYVFYHDIENNIVGYCPDPHMGQDDKITTIKLENNMVALIIEGEEGVTSLYIGDIIQARTGDLGFVYNENLTEYYPAGVRRYKDKQKCIFKKFINKKLILSNDLETLLLDLSSKKTISPGEIDGITDENCEVIAQPMIK